MRRMSFALTTQAVLDHRKTVTRRLGWKFLKAGDRLLAVDKLRTKSARILGVLEVVSTRMEPLFNITPADVGREGVLLPDCEHGDYDFEFGCPHCFVTMFVRSMKCEAGQMVNRIEFRYLSSEAGCGATAILGGRSRICDNAHTRLEGLEYHTAGRGRTAHCWPSRSLREVR